MTDIDALLEGIRQGHRVSLARAITILENRTEGYRELAKQVHRESTEAWVIGVTGSPGAGKSTLVDGLLEEFRSEDLRVGVLAIDPSSPFSGGSILGDRVRMRRAISDDGVFVRSMSTRGSLGGVSPATSDVIAAYRAFGMDRIIVETVGAGQNEVDIVRHADSICVVLPPASGDDVQMLKAGILEIADIFVINKMDLEGSNRTVTRLREMRRLDEQSDWDPPIVETVATNGSGVGQLRTSIHEHRHWSHDSGEVRERRHNRAISEIERILIEEFRGQLDVLLAEGGMEPLVQRVEEGTADPYTIAEEVLDDWIHQAIDKHNEAGGEP